MAVVHAGCRYQPPDPVLEEVVVVTSAVGGKERSGKEKLPTGVLEPPGDRFFRIHPEGKAKSLRSKGKGSAVVSGSTFHLLPDPVKGASGAFIGKAPDFTGDGAEFGNDVVSASAENRTDIYRRIPDPAAVDGGNGFRSRL